MHSTPRWTRSPCSPPNDGTLAATGKLGVDAGTGFDIYSSARGGVHALASLATSGGKSSLYTVSTCRPARRP